MFPLRYLTWAALAGSALAAFELDRLRGDLDRRRGAALWAIAILGAGLLAAGLTHRHFAPRYAAAGSLSPERNAYLLAGAALAAGIAVVAATGRRADRFAAIGIPLWTLVAGAELYRQGVRLNRMSDSALLYPSTPLTGFLRAQPGPFRVAGEGTELFPNGGVFAGLEDVRTHDPAERRDYVEFLDATCGYDPAPYFKQLADVNAPALDFLNVRYLVCRRDRTAPSEKWKPVYSGEDGTVFENRRVLPRVFAPERLRIVRHAATGVLLEPAHRAYGKSYRELFAGLDWSTEAVVLDDGRGGFRPSASSAGRRVGVTEYRETTNAVSFQTSVPTGSGEAILVTSLAEDGGWRAYDERNASIPVGRANGPFLALALPAGAHRIRLAYETPGWRLGAWISLGSLGVAAAVAVALRRRRRRGR
jgi:predicted nucleic acid-binding protein